MEYHYAVTKPLLYNAHTESYLPAGGVRLCGAHAFMQNEGIFLSYSNAYPLNYPMCVCLLSPMELV